MVYKSRRLRSCGRRAQQNSKEPAKRRRYGLANSLATNAVVYSESARPALDTFFEHL